MAAQKKHRKLTIVDLSSSVLSRILLQCNKAVAASAIQAHPELRAAWHHDRYAWMANQNANHCLVRLCEADDVQGVQQMLCHGACAVQEAIGSALIAAARKGSNSVLQLLLDKGTDVHHQDDAALQNAAGEGHVSTVQLLLNRGADIHANKDSALQYAALCAHTSTVELLLHRGTYVGVAKELAL